MKIKNFIKNLPVIGPIAKVINYSFSLFFNKFDSSTEYWENRYKAGGNSGSGSYNKFAQFKAEIINSFIDKHKIQSVIELGFGDGNQLTLMNYPKYIGFDISESAIEICRGKFKHDKNKDFLHNDNLVDQTADLSISLDVIYHLIEDEIYQKYLSDLCSTSNKFLIIYSSNHNDQEKYQSQHVKHRKFTNDIDSKDWHLIETIKNKYPYNGNDTEGTFADFFIFQRNN